MSWLLAADTAVFRFINQRLHHPVLDVVMPIFAAGAWFVSLVIIAGLVLFWKGGLRARVFLVMLGLILGLGDAFVVNPIKKATARQRPSRAVTDVILSPHVGRGGNNSMPSSHASTWAAAALIAFAYYPRSRTVLVPMALVVGFSRVYLGVHYPSDVLAGLILGAGYAAAGLWTFQTLWLRAGPKWFPAWFERLPSLVLRSEPPRREVAVASAARAARPGADEQFLYVGYILIAVLLVARLLYIASSKIELSEEEAWHWLWSKHLALGYAGKPPGIAYLEFLSNRIWGDTQFGVRFFAPLLATGLSVIVLRFFSRAVNSRAAFFLVLILNATPLFAAGAVLMTTEAPLVFFWTASMIAGWNAIQSGASTRNWLWAGLWAGLAFLFDYGALFLIPSWALFLLIWRPAREHLKHPGPWLTLLLLLLCTVPVVIWNWQHDWIGARQFTGEAELQQTLATAPDRFRDFTVHAAALLNPIVFVGALWAAGSAWKNRTENGARFYFLAMGAPVLLGYWLYSLRAPVPPERIATAVIPLFCLTVAHWHERWRAGVRAVKPWLSAALVLGLAVTILSHDTDLIRELTGRTLPARFDPLRRVRAIKLMVAEVEKAREDLAREGHETFIIGGHPGITSQLTFYLPEARAGLPKGPRVYPRARSEPVDQFFLWPEYRFTRTRNGQSAILVILTEQPGKPPPEILRQFESVTDLGLRQILYRRRAFHTIQLFACRKLL